MHFNGNHSLEYEASAIAREEATTSAAGSSVWLSPSRRSSWSWLFLKKEAHFYPVLASCLPGSLDSFPTIPAFPGVPVFLTSTQRPGSLTDLIWVNRLQPECSSKNELPFPGPSQPFQAYPGSSQEQLGKGEGASTVLAKWPSSLETLAQLNGDTWCLLVQLQEQYNKDQAESQAPHESCFFTKTNRSSSHHHQSFSPSQIVYFCLVFSPYSCL